MLLIFQKKNLKNTRQNNARGTEMMLFYIYIAGIIPAFFILARYIFSRGEHFGLVLFTLMWPFAFTVGLPAIIFIYTADFFSGVIEKLANMCRENDD